MPVQTTCRRAGVAVGATILLAALAGCHVGSDKESSSEGSSPNGEGQKEAIATENDTTVKNALIVPKFAPGSCTIQLGETADLRFFVTNNRHNEPERLLAITTPAAESVLIAPGPTMEVPAGQRIEVGEPTSADQPFTASLPGVNHSVKPGESVYVMFRFEEAGNIGIQVPIEKCPPPG